MGRRTVPPESIIAEITAIAAMSGGIATRAQALLQPLHRLTHFDAARITLFDPHGGAYPCLVSVGLDERIRHYLDGPEHGHTVEMLGMHRDRPPMRLKDLPMSPDEIPGWADYLSPAGFHEGIGVPLISPDRRYIGLFAAQTASARPASDATRDLLHRLAPLMAHAVDPMRTITALAALVTDASAGIILTPSGEPVALPGLPQHPLLAAGSSVLAEASTCYADGDTRATFLTPCRGPDPPGYLKVTMLACPDQLPHRMSAVVLLSPPGNLRQLSHREMTVLGMLIDGWTPGRIATRLRMPAFGIRTTLDTARLKFAAPTREAAVMRAADQGLYLPPNLVDAGGFNVVNGFRRG